MSLTVRPEKLPDSYDRLWEALSRMDDVAGSRQALAQHLKVSTHTIQRILVDGDVPDIGGSASRRQSLAWARTLTRLSLGLHLDPADILRETGFDVSAEMLELVDAEKDKMLDDSEETAPPVLALAEILLDVLQTGGGPGAGSLKKALGSYIELNTRQMRASEDEIEMGAYCRSCLASLRTEGGSSSEYCRWCSNGDGSLKSREEVLGIMTRWFMTWQKGIDRTEAERRAGHYMAAMPAWNP